MKVSGPGSSVPPEGAPPAGAQKPLEGKESKGAAFAEKLAEGDPATAATPAAKTEGAAPAGKAEAPGGTQSVRGADLVSDIATELNAGKVTAQAAVDRVVERILDRQLGLHAPAAVREKVGAALRDALETDPVFAEKMRALGG